MVWSKCIMKVSYQNMTIRAYFNTFVNGIMAKLVFVIDLFQNNGIFHEATYNKNKVRMV